MYITKPAGFILSTGNVYSKLDLIFGLQYLVDICSLFLVSVDTVSPREHDEHSC